MSTSVLKWETVIVNNLCAVYNNCTQYELLNMAHQGENIQHHIISNIISYFVNSSRYIVLIFPFRVKDNNPLGTQKTVSLDFDEEL